MTRACLFGGGGKMGRALAEALLESPDFHLALAVDTDPQSLEYLKTLSPTTRLETDPDCDMAGINAACEFTNPASALEIARITSAAGIPLLVGTTGLKPEQTRELEGTVGNRPLLTASNLSVGINLLKRLIRSLPKEALSLFDPEIIEHHHREKTDAPSGTALSLVETLREIRPDLAPRSRSLYEQRPRGQGEVGVAAVRGGGVRGVHTVALLGDSEELLLTHRLYSYDALALGGLLVLRFLASAAPGIYSVEDALGG